MKAENVGDWRVPIHLQCPSKRIGHVAGVVLNGAFVYQNYKSLGPARFEQCGNRGVYHADDRYALEFRFRNV